MQLPLFLPPSTWVAPTSLPDVRGEMVGLDIECRDDGLANNMGPGWPYGMGYIAGVSLTWSGGKIYAPLRHPESVCYDHDTVGRWIGSIFGSCTVCMHNASYDLGWLRSVMCLPYPRRLHDSMVMAAILDENRRGQYNLDAVARWRGVAGKNEGLLQEAALAFGIDPKREMWRLPAHYVGPYAEDDAAAALNCVQSMLPEIEQLELTDAYQLEIDLLPLLYEMRRRGIRIDSAAAERGILDIDRQRDQLLADLGRRVGRQLDVRAIGMVEVREKLFDSESLPYPKTPKTNRGSFKARWLEQQTHWLPRTLVKINKLQRLAHVFLEGHILGSMHRGRIHAEMHSTNSDEGGTRTSRFSYSGPPLQQMPSKVEKDSDDDRKMAVAAVRNCFLPENDTVWVVEDYSQQEPRLTVHFAAVSNCRGAEEAVRYFKEHPDPDYHTMVAEMTGLPRDPAKIINLALAYDKRVRALARDLKCSVEEAQSMMDQYHERLPFVKPLHDLCDRRAASRGYIKLIDGARRNYNLWNVGYTPDLEIPPCSYEEAMCRVADPDHPWYRGAVRRANTRTAMNALVQGSAARQTKRAMKNCWDEGFVPMLQMHDDLNFSISSDQESERIGEIMRDAIPLLVPMKVDREHGRSWGEATFGKYKTVEEIRRLT